MRTTMAARRHARRQRGTPGFCQGLQLAFVLAIKGALLSPNTPHFAAITRRIPTDGHARDPALAGAEHGNLGAERILITVSARLQMTQRARHAQARNLQESATGHSNVIRVGVGGIELGWQANAPISKGRQWFGHKMKVLALGVDKLSQ